MKYPALRDGPPPYVLRTSSYVMRDTVWSLKQYLKIILKSGECASSSSGTNFDKNTERRGRLID